MATCGIDNCICSPRTGSTSSCFTSQSPCIPPSLPSSSSLSTPFYCLPLVHMAEGIPQVTAANLFPLSLYPSVSLTLTLSLPSFLPSGSGQVQSTSSTSHTPFSAEEVLQVYRYDNGDSTHPHGSTSSPVTTHPSTPSQLAMLYYILLYQDTYHSNLKTLCMCVCT